MGLRLRPGRPSDAPDLGRICHDAFATLAQAHGFPPDFPDVETAEGVLGMLLAHPGFFGVVAEEDGKIIGSNFLDERGAISGIGPVTVDPKAQNRQCGTQLMRAVMERSDAKGFAGVRLVQTAYHCRSLSLYSKLGFEVREHLSCFQGPAIKEKLDGYDVRAATDQDFDECDTLCVRIHGHHRRGELRDGITQATATVVERNGRITGYASNIGYFGHVVAETTDDLKALIANAPSFMGPGFLVPSQNGELMRWCLGKGLRLTQMLTLMTKGLYSQPTGAWLPSILY